MSKQREALELALEAMNNFDYQWYEAKDAIREALAESELEPVVWVKIKDGEVTHVEMSDGTGVDMDLSGWTPLYTAPPARKPLTDDEIMLLANETSTKYWGTEAHLVGLARAIERAHGVSEA